MNLLGKPSNLSYTNKDFNSIYVELLEYAKKLSYKWDPSTSDESDPGVVLLKLAALIGDKNNYNIDKNILELFPESVTQYPSARQLFEQCGYNMSYYNGATGFVNLTLLQDLPENKEDIDDYIYDIPRFTMFSDVDKNIVYTSTKPVFGVKAKTSYPIDVIQGIATKYTINNDELITTQHVDSRNRLYFVDSNIAENGIFISNVAESDSLSEDEWEKVDNLYTTPLGKKCFKFGVTVDDTACYIEFPDDYETLFGEGINITYIRTEGKNGNISRGILKQFYNDVKLTQRRTTDDTYNVSVSADADKVSIVNTVEFVNGENPETISSAYKSYKRVRDTFETLVSLKDYTDYLVTSGSASNGYVCDRTNDIQFSYKLLKNDEDVTHITTVVEQDNKKDKLNAFNLCVYALQYTPSVTTTSLFKRSFSIVDLNNDLDYKTKIDEVKSLQHDFKSFETNRILMLKNRYAITCNVVPKVALSLTEKYEVISSIETALCELLNSNNITFGGTLNYQEIQQTIVESDARISTIVDFVSPTFETYAVYKSSVDGGQDVFSELRIDSNAPDGGYVKVSPKASDFKNCYYLDNKGDFQKDNTFDSRKQYYKYDQAVAQLWDSFRAEIYAKSVLSGVTPLYNKDVRYKLGVHQNLENVYEGIAQISGTSTITCKDENHNGVFISPKLAENENILLTAPNFIQENKYSNYVKVVYNLKNDVSAGTTYQLDAGEYVTFFWKVSDSDEHYKCLKYDGSDKSKSKIIRPNNMGLTRGTSTDTTLTDFCANLNAGITSTTTSGVTEKIKDIADDKTAGQIILTGQDEILTLKVNTVQLNNKENGCSDFYWILNTVNSAGNCVLFDGDPNSDLDAEVYTLRSGEYFLYTNSAKSALYILGEGTLIKRNFEKGVTWAVPYVPYEQVVFKGISAINNWFTVVKDDEDKIEATEQKTILIGPGCQLKISGYDDKGTGSINIQSDIRDLSGCELSYIDETDQDQNIETIAVGDAGWSAISILNLELSSDKPFTLHAHQKITLLDNYDEQIKEVNKDSAKELKVLTNQPIDAFNTTVDVPTYSDELLGIITYTESTTEENSGITYSEDSASCEIIWSRSEEEDPEDEVKEITFTPLAGNYILQITGDVTSVSSVEPTNADLEKLYNYDDETKTSEIYKLTVSAKKQVKLTFKVNKSTDGRIIINPLYKYNTDNLSDYKFSYKYKIEQKAGEEKTIESLHDEVLEKLSKLDSHVDFNYTYSPTNPITDPLASKEFLNKRHPYNQYTICEWDTNVASDVGVLDPYSY